MGATKKLEDANGFTGTPTFIVGGKYGVKMSAVKSWHDAMLIIEFLHGKIMSETY